MANIAPREYPEYILMTVAELTEARLKLLARQSAMPHIEDRLAFIAREMQRRPYAAAKGYRR